MCAGKAAKFLGKLGRRVARSKHGGGGTADAAPTPLINDAYGGTPGCASASMHGRHHGMQRVRAAPGSLLQEQL